MFNYEEQLFVKLHQVHPDTAKSVIKMWALSMMGTAKEIRDAFIADGYEHVDAPKGAALVGEGESERPVVWVHGFAFALPVAEFQRRRSQSFDDAKLYKAAADAEAEARATKNVSGTETLSGALCPRCQENMQETKVCPSCAAGKAGYKYSYSCVCGVDFLSREKI